jgi:hypothetical protein
MHDRQIVATAIILQNQGETVALLTCDRNITDSGVISVIWRSHLTCCRDSCVFNLSRGLGEAFGYEIIRWEAEIVAQMLHPYSFSGFWFPGTAWEPMSRGSASIAISPPA